MRVGLCAALLILATLVAATTATSELRAPERLSLTGLYEPERPGVIAAANKPFAPQYALWSDGAEKRRWVYLPPGAAIDATDPNAWEVPVGTRFWKEFAFGDRKVETRMIWRASRERWIFATYVWNAEGTDAMLAPDAGVLRAAPLGDGKYHAIPSVSDCTACHGVERPGPLGFTALQLSPDRDPLAVHAEPITPEMVTLDTLVAEKRLSPAPDAGIPSPRIRSYHPRTRAMLGYLLANCGSCHNGRGEIAALGPVLKVEDLVRDGDAVARSFLGQRTRWQVPGVPDGTSVLIDAESLDQSALLTRMRSRRPSSQMPPLGTVLRDTEALERLHEWLRADLVSAH